MMWIENKPQQVKASKRIFSFSIDTCSENSSCREKWWIIYENLEINKIIILFMISKKVDWKLEKCNWIYEYFIGRITTRCEQILTSRIFNNPPFRNLHKSDLFSLCVTDYYHYHMMKFPALWICGLLLLVGGKGAHAWGGLFNRFSPEMLSNMGYGSHGGSSYRPQPLFQVRRRNLSIFFLFFMNIFIIFCLRRFSRKSL